jgi:hypothetical protein
MSSHVLAARDNDNSLMIWLLCMPESAALTVGVADVFRHVQVETYDGWRATAKTFVSGPLAQLHAEVVPTERYMKQLREGAAQNYLDPLYQAWLSSIETVPSVGLPPEYYDTPAKYIAYSFLVIVALLVAGFFVQQ